MFDDVTLSSIASLVAASFFGALIGLEREIHGRPAGFRTHLLVSLGSALYVLVSVSFYKHYGNFSGTMPVGVDPGRVAAQVVTGIGFLGAGAIIREGASIRGLTTAACLWIVAAIGVACGVGMFGTACIVTFIALLSLLLLKKAEDFIPKDVYFALIVTTMDSPGFLDNAKGRLSKCGIEIVNLSISKNLESAETKYSLQIRHHGRELPCEIIDSLEEIAEVKRIEVS